MAAASGVKTELFMVGREIEPGKFRFSDAFTSESDALTDQQDRSNNDPLRNYAVIHPLSRFALIASSGALQTQIDKSWSVNFSYSSQTAKTFKTNSLTFEKTTPFCFPGTADKASPTVARIFGFTQHSSTTMTARVFDVTNGNEIAQMTINDVNVVMAEDTALTNLPSGMAEFEIQIKSSDKKSVELESFEMR